jgi:hypothetical protein
MFSVFWLYPFLYISSITIDHLDYFKELDFEWSNQIGDPKRTSCHLVAAECSALEDEEFLLSVLAMEVAYHKLSVLVRPVIDITCGERLPIHIGWNPGINAFSHHRCVFCDMVVVVGLIALAPEGSFQGSAASFHKNSSETYNENRVFDGIGAGTSSRITKIKTNPITSVASISRDRAES